MNCVFNFILGVRYMLLIVKVAMRRMVIGVIVTEKDGSTDSLTHCRVRH